MLPPAIPFSADKEVLRGRGATLPVIVLGPHGAFWTAVEIARLEATDFLFTVEIRGSASLHFADARQDGTELT